MQGQFFAMFNGHVGSEPQITDFPDGGCIANFSVATKHIWIDNEGAKQERLYWANCVAYGKLANLIADYVPSGKPIMITQSYPELVEWNDKTTGLPRSATRFVVQALQFLDSAPAERPVPPPMEEVRGVRTNHAAMQAMPIATVRPSRGNGVRKFGSVTTPTASTAQPQASEVPEVITQASAPVTPQDQQKLEDAVNNAPRTGAGKGRNRRNRTQVPANTVATPVVVATAAPTIPAGLDDDLPF